MDNAFDVLGSLNLLGGIRGTSPVDAWNQGALAAQQLEQNRNTLAQQQMEMRKASQLEQRQADYQRDLAAIPQSGNMFLGMSRMIAKYPEFKDALKASYDSFDQQTQRAELRQASDIWHLVKNGMIDRAVELLEARVQSERNAGGYSTGPNGRDTGDGNDPGFYEGQLKLLKSGNPKAIAAVQDGLAAFMAATVPDKFASVLERAGTAGKDWKVVGPTVGYGDEEGNWHTAYVAPDRFTIGSEGGTRFETPGTSATPSGPLSVETALPAIVAQESGGNYAARNAKTGAMGAYQVMPATGKALAGRLDLPWRPDLMTSDTPEARAYQDQVGRAAVTEAVDASGGDPLIMAAYYHGGSDRSKWGPKTRQYASEVVARLGGQPGGAIATASVPKAPAAAKDTAYQMAPEQVAAMRLDPNQTWFMQPNGVPVAVKGGGQQVTGAYSQSALDAFDRAIGTANRLLQHPGLSAAVGSGFDPSSWGTYNPITGKTFAGTDAADFGAELNAMKAQVFLPMVQSMKGMGALSNAEGEKLTAAIGALSTDQSEKQFKASLNRIVTDLKTYKQRGMPTSAGQGSSAQPIRVRSLQQAMKLKPGTIFIDPYGRRKVR